MTFQETHVSDNNYAFINSQFQAHQFLWTRHCDIVSFNPSYALSPDMIPDNDRAILTRVEHPHGAFLPFYVLVLYAPASSGKLRQKFFGGIYDILHQSTIDVDLDRLFIMGDFNYSYQRRNLFSQTSMQWVSFLETLFSNALTKDDLHELPTFRRNDDIFSTIDYIFVSDSLRTQLHDSNLQKLDASWTDHSLLSTTCCIGTATTSPDLWILILF